MNMMRESIEDVDIEIEQKDEKRDFLGNKIMIPDSKANEELNRLGLNKISSKRKGDRFMDRFNISPKTHKYIKEKKH